jgi:hypothetical protein
MTASVMKSLSIVQGRIVDNRSVSLHGEIAPQSISRQTGVVQPGYAGPKSLMGKRFWGLCTEMPAAHQ